MPNTKRLIYEIGSVVALVLLFAGLFFGQQKWLRYKHGKETARMVLERNAMSKRLRGESLRNSASQARRETKAVLTAFVAGLYPSLLDGNTEAVDTAVATMIRFDKVSFVHCLDPNGGVIASSDRKLTTKGSAGNRAKWALESTELHARKGELSGTTEAAMPVQGPGGPIAFVWIGYETNLPPNAAGEP